LFGQFVLHDSKFLHHGGVLFLGPGTGEILVVVAKDGVEHAERFLFVWKTFEYARSRQGEEEILGRNYFAAAQVPSASRHGATDITAAG
jgi:hypothetical protein